MSRSSLGCHEARCLHFVKCYKRSWIILEATLGCGTTHLSMEGRSTPHLRTPNAGLLCQLFVGGTRWQQLRAHLLRVHLLLDERVYQLLPVLVHQIFALVRDGAREVAAHKLPLSLNLIDGGLVVKPLVDHGDGKLAHLARQRVVQGSLHLDHLKGDWRDGI